MQHIKSIYTYAIAFIFLSISYSSFAHYGPRGLLGGTPRVGIQHNGMVYIGTEDAGVFESTNTLLVSWRLRAVGLKSGRITALEHSGAELYAATADSGVFIFNGVVGSDKHWNPRSNGLGNASVRALLAVDANTLFAGSNGNGLYKTTDKGMNWSTVNTTALNGKRITALTKGGNRLFALVLNGGVFASDDNGVTWNDLNDANTLNKNASEYFSYNATTDELMVSNTDGLFVLPAASATNSPVYSAAGAGLPTGTIVNSLSNNGNDWFIGTVAGVYQTASSSINWAAANTGLPANEISLVVSVGDTLIAGALKAGVFKSDAAAINWSASNTGMTNINTYSLACKGDSIVATATEYGVAISTNIGNNPVLMNTGLTDSLRVTDLDFAENLLFAATATAGVFMTNNLGQSWTAQNTGLSSTHIKRVVYGSGRIYAIDIVGKVFESDLPTIAWRQVATGLPFTAVATSLTFFSNYIAVGTLGDGVYVKERNGASWSAFNTGLSSMMVTSITYSAGKLYAGTDGFGVHVSDAKTAGWAAAAPISIPHHSNVALDPSYIQYMTTAREYVIATYKGGIVGTTDGGATWVPAGNQFNLPSYSNIRKASYVTSRMFLTTETNNAHSGGMGELHYTDSLLVVNDVVFNAPIQAAESYHSITSNVEWKISTTATWVTMSVNSGFWNKDIKLTVADNFGSPRTATVTVTGDTMVRTITINQQGFSGISTTATAEDVRLYPNPNNGRFVVDFSAYEGVHTISVTDVTGRQLREIAVQQQQKQIEVSEQLLPGVYFIQLQTAGGDIVKRVVVE